MKANRTYYLDMNIIEKLQDENASELINELLTKHFNLQKEKDKNPKPINSELIKVQEKEEKQRNAKDERRDKERLRAKEFEKYIQDNNIKLDKLQFMDLMYEYSDNSSLTITQFIKTHKSIK